MQNQLPKFLRVSLSLALLFLVFAACSSQTELPRAPIVSEQTQPLPSPTASPESEIAVSDLLKQLPFLEKEKRAGLLRAWARVPGNKNYRATNPSDFESTTMTNDYGEMAGAYGLAALIIDKSMAAPERFSLVIFIERPANKYDVYWIYKNMNLTRYRMSRASGNLFVDEVHEDGTKTVCKIEWDRKQNRWACGRSWL